MSMQLGDGSKHKRLINKIGIKNKMMLLSNNMKRKNCMKPKKPGV